MNKEQRDQLRKLAEEATPGPWLYDETELPAQRIHHPEGFLVARVAQMRTDGRHIAAANPSTILQLLDYIETLEKDAGRYRWLSEYLVSDRTDMDDAIVACDSTTELSAVIDAALGETE